MHTITLNAQRGRSVSINLPKLRTCLILGFLCLLAGHIGAMYVRHGLGFYLAKGLVPLFHFDSEFNIPTIYSVALIGLCSLALMQICRQNDTPSKDRAAWFFLSVLFAFLAADELFSIHEFIDQTIRGTLQTEGAFHFAWVIPYGILLGLLAVLLLPWFFRQPQRLQVMFAIAGMLYIGGALGLEMVGGNYYSGLDPNRAEYATLTGDIISSFEEVGEILGLSLFLYTMAAYLGGDDQAARTSA